MCNVFSHLWRYDIILLGGFMEKYNNEEQLELEIMGQGRHQFIYGYNNEKRKQFIANMVNNYPVVFDENVPIAISVSEIGLPKVPMGSKNIDKDKISVLSSEFLNFSMVSAILLRAKETSDLDVLNNRLRYLINMLNKYSINQNCSPITDVDDLIRILIQSKEFYKKYYVEYYEKGIESASLDELALPFMSTDRFVSQFKDAINNRSYLGIIIDKQDDIALSSTKAINGLVAGRINKDISMKIVTEPDKWDLYYELNGQIIQRVDDYGTVELDDSQSDYLKKLKEKRYGSEL